mmetsp:Transcript_24172/g.51797  ORF Transcript_24172/g.51797 Transcript_24172/m.51797 type:complete len:284 (-) Transcript_24172:131-982(-)
MPKEVGHSVASPADETTKLERCIFVCVQERKHQPLAAEAERRIRTQVEQSILVEKHGRQQKRASRRRPIVVLVPGEEAAKEGPGDGVSLSQGEPVRVVLVRSQQHREQPGFQRRQEQTSGGVRHSERVVVEEEIVPLHQKASPRPGVSHAGQRPTEEHRGLGQDFQRGPAPAEGGRAAAASRVAGDGVVRRIRESRVGDATPRGRSSVRAQHGIPSQRRAHVATAVRRELPRTQSNDGADDVAAILLPSTGSVGGQRDPAAAVVRHVAQSAFFNASVYGTQEQ